MPASVRHADAPMDQMTVAQGMRLAEPVWVTNSLARIAATTFLLTTLGSNRCPSIGHSGSERQREGRLRQPVECRSHGRRIECPPGRPGGSSQSGVGTGHAGTGTGRAQPRRNLDAHARALVQFRHDTDGASHEPDALLDADQPQAFDALAGLGDIEPAAVIDNRELRGVSGAAAAGPRRGGLARA